LRRLRIFSAKVCVKRSRKRRAKLNKHSFNGVFIGYTATIANVRYINLKSGLVKTCGHATFDEAWYCTASRPPEAQLLYDLGLEKEVAPVHAQAPPEQLPPPQPPLSAIVLLDTPVVARLDTLPLILDAETPAAARQVAKRTKE
jgi:hypothetical protein